MKNNEQKINTKYYTLWISFALITVGLSVTTVDAAKSLIQILGLLIISKLEWLVHAMIHMPIKQKYRMLC